MDDFDDFHSGQDGTVFRDVIMLALLGFMVIVVILLPHLNPPAKSGEMDPPGSLIVEVRWPDSENADVDLWVKAPGERPVGYSNQSGKVFNLLRDDLGKRGDSTGLNYEFAFSRGTKAGEYTVNLHLYSRAPSVTLPLEATVVVKLKPVPDRPTVELLSRKVMLRHNDEEKTVTRFRLDEQGQLVPYSINDMPRALRGMG